MERKRKEPTLRGQNRIGDHRRREKRKAIKLFARADLRVIRKTTAKDEVVSRPRSGKGSTRERKTEAEMMREWSVPNRTTVSEKRNKRDTNAGANLRDRGVMMENQEVTVPRMKEKAVRILHAPNR